MLRGCVTSTTPPPKDARHVSPVYLGPVHIVAIPKNREGLTQLSKAREDQKDILGHLQYVIHNVGKKECPSRFRLVINDGEHKAQSVYHRNSCSA
jgi:histidine triad (HIT) family protein